VDDVVCGELVDTEADWIDGFSWKGLPLGTHRHTATILARLRLRPKRCASWKKRASHMSRKQPVKTAPLSSVSPLDAYLTHLTVERRLAANSIESYARDLQGLAEFAAGRKTSADALSLADLEAFVRDLMASGRSPRSVARAIACYRGFYRFLV